MVHSMLRALMVATAVASLFFVVATIVAQVGLPLLRDQAVLLASALTFAAVFLVATTIRLAHPPSLADLASRGDRSLDLQNRLRTALELSEKPNAALSLVEKAAIEDAAPYARALLASQVVQWRLPRWAWLVPLAACTAGAAALLNPPPLIEPSATRMVSVGEGRKDSTVTTIVVRKVVEALNRDAEVERDEYLNAVRRELASFSERLDGEELDEGERAELDRLLEHLAQATASREDSVGRLLKQLAESGLRTPQTPAGYDGFQPAASAAGEGTGVLAEEQTSDIETVELSLGFSAEKPVDNLLGELEQALADVEASRSVPGQSQEMANCDVEALLYGGICEQELLPGQERSGFVQEGEGAGVPVGAAEAADDRAGDAAGEGSQPDNIDLAGHGLPEVEGELESVALPKGEESKAGAHFEVDGISGPSDGAVDPIGGVRRLAEHKAEEAAISQQVSGTGYHEVVRNYFLPARANGFEREAWTR